jgi:hypothetical protein
MMLAIVPGTVLKEIYETYSARLLELNVRSFLQARGKVNQGIRDTIVNDARAWMSSSRIRSPCPRSLVQPTLALLALGGYRPSLPDGPTHRSEEPQSRGGPVSRRVRGAR